MKLLDSKAAAEILSVKPTSLLDPRYRARIGLRAVRVGKSVRFHLEDLEKLAARGVRGAVTCDIYALKRIEPGFRRRARLKKRKEYSMVRKSPSPTQWETACRWCGVISEHVIAPGRGIHHAELRCESCNTHLRWLSAKNPEERQRLAKQYREQYAMQQQPTAKQLAYLRHLGHCGELPQSMLVASQLIAKLLQEGDGE